MVTVTLDAFDLYQLSNLSGISDIFELNAAVIVKAPEILFEIVLRFA